MDTDHDTGPQPEPLLETGGPDATEAAAAALGRIAPPGLVIALDGEMGAGKTTFVRGLAAGLDSPDAVSSPTYTLMHVYRGRHELRHFDAWMSAREGAFLASGGGEDLLDGDAVCALEWAAEVEAFLPEDRLTVELALLDLERRRLAARAGGPRAARALAAWRTELERVMQSDEPPGGRDVGGPR